MTEPSTKTWTSICLLTNQAMDALVEIEQGLMAVDDQTLGPLEFRTLVWARCTLATLYGIRADETIDEAALSDLRRQLEDVWSGSLPVD
ncbi:MAG: hypothetical protein M0Z30_00520 [Actinomycetota bacterium]|nr:hypothetical protein [Actinomycetota bacterium]